MVRRLEIYYYGSLEVPSSELTEALNAALSSGEYVDEVSTTKIEGYESRFGHLLPEGLGGDDDLGFREAIELILAFGTVQAFLVFAKAFLSKSGEMLAEKLFKPLSETEREKALVEEKARREDWRSVADKMMEVSREYGEWSEERKKEEYEQWRKWGEAGETVSYNATYSIDIYVEEKDAKQHIRFELNNEDLEALGMYPFIRAPEDRFRENFALGLIQLMAELEDKENRNYEEDVDKRKKTTLEIRQMLREAQRQKLL